MNCGSKRHRAEQKTDDWKGRYKVRAGVEAPSLERSAVVACTDPVPGPGENQSLQHQLTGTAVNLARIDSHLTGTPRARARTSHSAQLRPADQMIDGAKKA